MTRDEWVALLDNEDVRELLVYVEFVRTWKDYHSSAHAVIDVLKAGKSRVEQLRKYQIKRQDPNATFRPYAPIKASETTRVEAKRRALAEGVATPASTGCGVGALCGHEGLDGRRCWLAPHNEIVPHRF